MGLSSSRVRVDHFLKTMKTCCSGDEEGEYECEWLEGQEHPLLNHLINLIKLEEVRAGKRLVLAHPYINLISIKILIKIFQDLRGKELKECRLVCKTWNVATIPYTRKALYVNILADDDDKWKIRRMESFIECLSSNKFGIPFDRFRLGSLCTTTDGAGQEFLQLCGPTISSIEILGSETFMIEDISEILRLSPKLETFSLPNHLRSRSGNIVKLFPYDSIPQLTSLETIIVKNDMPEERDEFCPTFLEELIMAAPNISCLDLWDSYSWSRWFNYDVDGRSSSLQIMSLIEKLDRASSIQKLRISYLKREESELIELLLKMSRKFKNGLKLRVFDYRLSITDESCEINHAWMGSLVSHFNDTLQNLIIETPCLNCLVFKRMLRVTIYWSQYLNSILVGLSNIFPVLEELIVLEKMCDQEKEFDDFFPDSDPCLNLKTLEICGHQLKIHGFNQIMYIFPNLTKLRVTIKWDGVEILRQIWSQLTQLKYLCIDGIVETKDSLDSVLNGISTLDVQEIRDTVRNFNKTMTRLKRNDLILKLRHQYSRFPSIANLTNLRLLILDLHGVENINVDTSTQTHVTDLTGYFGLYSLQRLEQLYVEQCEMTKTCCKILTKDMGLESWTFQSHDYESIIPSSSENWNFCTFNGIYPFKSLQ